LAAVNDVCSSQRPLSSLSLLLCHSKAETARIVLFDELNSGLFERCLDPDHCRNIAGDWAMTFFDALNRGRSDTASNAFFFAAAAAGAT
jgi:hypothetical protein